MHLPIQEWKAGACRLRNTHHRFILWCILLDASHVWNMKLYVLGVDSPCALHCWREELDKHPARARV